MAIHGKDGKIQITGASTSATDVTMSDTGNGTLWEVSSSNEDKDVWDPTAQVTVEEDPNDDGTYQTFTGGYTERYLTGRIDFDSDQSSNNIRVDVNYLPKFQVGEATSGTFNIETDVPNPSKIDEDGENREYGRVDVTVDVERVSFGDTPIDGSGGTEERYLEILKNQSLAVIEFNADTNATNPPLLRAYCRLDPDSIDIPNEGLISSSMTFVGDQLTANSKNNAQPNVARFKQQ